MLADDIRRCAYLEIIDLVIAGEQVGQPVFDEVAAIGPDDQAARGFRLPESTSLTSPHRLRDALLRVVPALLVEHDVELDVGGLVLNGSFGSRRIAAVFALRGIGLFRHRWPCLARRRRRYSFQALTAGSAIRSARAGRRRRWCGTRRWIRREDRWDGVRRVMVVASPPARSVCRLREAVERAA